ncbi:hypothetical protein MTO96_001522 [Rhipicephalus appendiculatus]
MRVRTVMRNAQARSLPACGELKGSLFPVTPLRTTATRLYYKGDAGSWNRKAVVRKDTTMQRADRCVPSFFFKILASSLARSAACLATCHIGTKSGAPLESRFARNF